MDASEFQMAKNIFDERENQVLSFTIIFMRTKSISYESVKNAFTDRARFQTQNKDDLQTIMRRWNVGLFNWDVGGGYTNGPTKLAEWNKDKMIYSILKDKPKSDNINGEEHAYLEQEDQVNLLRTLVQYPTITHTAYRTLEPVTISTYLFCVTEQLSLCFESNQAIDTLSEGKRSFFEAVQTVLENCMNLLGVS
jgi:DALR anticodon binding protein